MQGILFDVELSFDYISLSFAKPPSMDMSIYLSSRLTFKQSVSRNYGLYAKIEEYEKLINNKIYTILLLLPYSPKIPPSIRLEHPDKYFIKFCLLSFWGLGYHISEIELTYDFKTNDRTKLYNIIKNSAYLKWPGAELILGYKDTHYFNNKRKARSKAAKLYIKTKDVISPVVRFELIFKREILKSNNIFDLRDLYRIDYSLISKYLVFKRFDYRLFKIRYMVNSNGVNWKVKHSKIVNSIVKLIKQGRLNKANKVSRDHVYYSNLKDHYFGKIFKSIMKYETFK